MRRFSRNLYQRIYGRDVYDEPVASYLPIVAEYLSGGTKGSPNRILDAACGFNNVFLRPLLIAGQLQPDQLIGMDINPAAQEGNVIHQQVRIQDLHEPIDLDGFQSIISVYTWEHLHTPEQVLDNFHKALKVGGKLIIIAPQKYNYASLIERMLPWRLKDLAWKLLKGKDGMPYPTFFRLCTRSSLSQAARQQGFEVREWRSMEPAPIWFQVIPPIFVVMCLWASIANRLPLLAGTRGVFLAVLEKCEA